MPHVLLASFPIDALDDVRIALLAAGHDVAVVEDVEGLVEAARDTEFAVAVIADLLIGGSGAEACAALSLLPFPPATLVLSDGPTPNADAFAPADELELILEQVAALAETRTPEPAPKPVPASVPVNAPVNAPVREPEPVPVPGRSAPGSSSKPTNGKAHPIDFPALLRRVRESDYFTILDISPSATPAEIEAAHASLSRSLADSAKESPIRHQHLEEVEAALAEALDVLSSPSLRAAYTRNKL